MSKVAKPYPIIEDTILNKVEDAPSPPFRSDGSVMFPFATSRPQSQMTAFEKMGLVRQGISKTDFEGFKEKAGLDYDQLAATLAVARATLINKKGVEKFNSTLSEKIVSLADIYSYGYEVFEDIKVFNQWVFRPNLALGGAKPYDLLDNQYGREEVRDLIGRIDYGVYS